MCQYVKKRCVNIFLRAGYSNGNLNVNFNMKKRCVNMLKFVIGLDWENSVYT